MTAPSGMGPLAWRYGFRLKCKVSGRARGSLSEGAGFAKQRLREFVPNLFCEKGVLKSPQTFQNPKIQNIFSADDAQSKRGAHSDGFLPWIHKGVAAVHCHEICRHEAPDDGLAQDDGVVGVARDEHQHKDHLAH